MQNDRLTGRLFYEGDSNLPVVDMLSHAAKRFFSLISDFFSLRAVRRGYYFTQKNHFS